MSNKRHETKISGFYSVWWHRSRDVVHLLLHHHHHHHHHLGVLCFVFLLVLLLMYPLFNKLAPTTIRYMRESHQINNYNNKIELKRRERQKDQHQYALLFNVLFFNRLAKTKKTKQKRKMTKMNYTLTPNMVDDIKLLFY